MAVLEGAMLLMKCGVSLSRSLLYWEASRPRRASNWSTPVLIPTFEPSVQLQTLAAFAASVNPSITRYSDRILRRFCLE